MDELAREIGEMVRWHRRRAGLSQKDLADLAGVGKTVVFDVEKGKPTARLDTLVSILGALNIRVAFEGPLMARFRETR